MPAKSPPSRQAPGKSPPASASPQNPPSSPPTPPQGAATPPPPGAATAPRTEPAPNPLRSPPPPELPKRGPGRPRKSEIRPAAAPASAPEPPAAPSRWRVLSVEPAERAAQLASVEGETELVVSVLSVLASRLPPGRPLSPEEVETIKGPLAQCVWKYGGDVGPEAQLALALGMLALGRYVEAKNGGAAVGDDGDPQRAPPKVKVVAP